jgi:hypothetical protein
MGLRFWLLHTRHTATRTAFPGTSTMSFVVKLFSR